MIGKYTKLKELFRLMIRRIVACPSCHLHFLSARRQTFCPGCHVMVEPEEVTRG